MAKTRHIHKRMSQRGITDRMLEVVSDFGMIQGDKRILDRKNIDALMNSMDCLRKDLLKLRDKGGLVIVEADDMYITAYNIDSYDRTKNRARV